MTDTIVLSNDSVVSLPNCHRDIQLTEDEIYFIPNLKRRLLRKNIVIDYYSYTNDDPKEIKRSTKYQILKLITL